VFIFLKKNYKISKDSCMSIFANSVKFLPTPKIIIIIIINK